MGTFSWESENDLSDATLSVYTTDPTYALTFALTLRMIYVSYPSVTVDVNFDVIIIACDNTITVTTTGSLLPSYDYFVGDAALMIPFSFNVDPIECKNKL